MDNKIQFGTDGWRGIIADDFTSQNVRRVAQATADYWNSAPIRGRVKAAIVGYDNRFLSEVFARIVCEVLAANKIEALYAPTSVPTPAVSYSVMKKKLRGGIMITASHNPPLFNGYKLKAWYAGPADPDICKAVESYIDRSPVRAVNFEKGIQLGKIQIFNPLIDHVASLKTFVDIKKIRNTSLRVAIDSMHGSGVHVLEKLLSGGRCKVTTIRSERDAFFGGINPEPIEKNLGALCDYVKKTRANVGLATDGDADRLGLVDDKGRYVSVQLVYALLLTHLIKNRPKQKANIVVKTANCTVLIDRICKAHGLEMKEVPVGFKHVCKLMQEESVLIGGEESGGFGFFGHIPERDGMLANLLLLEMMALTKKSISKLIDEIQLEYGDSVYRRIDMPFPLKKRRTLLNELEKNPPKKLHGSTVVEVNTSDGVKFIAEDDTWLMFRPSGTEPIIRIYCESDKKNRVDYLLAQGKKIAIKVAE